MADPLLSGKKVILGVTGGIAAYKAADLCSKLVQAGAEVDVILTDAAARFVAPLSANTLAKLALGLADNLLTGTLLATPIRGLEHEDAKREEREVGVPWVLAPAMESHMWSNALTQAHMAALVARGVVQVGPGVGRLASGASGAGRMAEPAEILAAARLALAREGPLSGRRVLVTAGGTQEPLDPVRYITNASSGKMGVALAEAARDMGAQVALVHAPLAVAVPFGVESVKVRTAMEMCEAVLSRVGQTDFLIGAAAVADFRPAEAASQKIKKAPGQEGLTVQLVRNPDILAEVAARRAETGWPKVVVGFAAETQDLLANAAAKLAAKKLDIIVANDVAEAGSGFGADDNRVTLLYPDGRRATLGIMPKPDVARRVLEAALTVSGR